MTVIADPAKLRELAKKLKAAGEQIEQLQRHARSALQASGWEGKDRQQFEAELQRDLKAALSIGGKLRSAYPTTLERKARALDEFRR